MSSSRGARIFVWTVWVAMVAVAIGHLAVFARDVPLAEDWNLVAPLTGNEPSLAAWLWSQNNEHRLPLPRLLMLGLLKVSGGDFRSGMVMSVALVALLAAAMIEVARRLRGGYSRYTDAFFPVLLLEVGDWQDLFWHWQLAFVLSVVLIGAAFLAIVRRPALDSPLPAIITGVALVLAPLTGGSGLLFVPAILLYAGWRGLYLIRSKASDRETTSGRILLGSVVLSAAICTIYMAGYQRPEWVPENPGIVPSLWTAVQFQTLGLGPAVRTSWGFWIGVSLVLLLAATIQVLRQGMRGLGLLMCLLSAAGFAAGIGWGRAAVIDVYHGWPDRYVLLAAPAFCLAYFAWELPGHEAVNRLGRRLLFGATVLLLPMNTAFGREWGSWYSGGMDAVIRDIDAGTPRDLLATRHNEMLYHAWPPGILAQHMQMLHDRRIGPFAGMVTSVDSILPPALDSVTVRYHQPDAADVRLVWWFQDGRRVPLSLRPAGTTDGTRGTAVSTPMERSDSIFSATLRVPPRDSLEFGFMIMARNDGDTLSGIWDGTTRYVPDSVPGPATVDAHPRVSVVTNPLKGSDTLLVQQTLRYGPTDAKKVRVVWGIDAWQSLPEPYLPPRTRTTATHLTLTAMEQSGAMFETVLPVPAGRQLDFSFQVDRADRFEISDNNGGKNYALIATRDSVVTIRPSLDLVTGSRLSTVFTTGLVAFLAFAALAAGSALIGNRGRPV